MLFRFLNSERGSSSLIVVIIVSSILAFIGANLLFFSESDIHFTKRTELSKKAFFIAESGINNYLWRLNHDIDVVDEGWTPFDQGEYSLNVTQGENTSLYTVESTGRISHKFSPSKTTAIEEKIVANIQKRSFTRYLYLTDFETVEGTSQRIYFISGDVMKGPLHSNDQINISGSPVFEGKVTTSRTISMSGGSNPDFQQGYEENVAPLEMPATNQELKIWAQVSGYYYYGITTIDFLSNGNLIIANSNPNSTGPVGTVSPPSNGVIYVDGQVGSKFSSNNGDVFVQGTYSGRLTVGAKNNIYITGDVVYDNSQSDMLGLIAENYIYINHRDRRGRDVAPYNLEINAAIFSLNHSFGYEDYRYGLKGTLTIRGAIIQRYRGPVGTFSGNTKRSGYSKNYFYDERMIYEEPPHFIEPLNAGYEIIKWKTISPQN